MSNPAGRDKDGRWLPIVLSAGICPGLGQFAQGRKVAGTLLLLVFLAGFGATVYLLLQSLIDTVAHIKGEIDQPKPIPKIQLIAAGGVCVISYCVNVLDVCAAERKRKTTNPDPA